MSSYQGQVGELALVPSHGGRFEVSRDDAVIFSKAELGRHADIDEVVAAIERNQRVTA